MRAALRNLPAFLICGALGVLPWALAARLMGA